MKPGSILILVFSNQRVTLQKNATKLGDTETLGLIEVSRASKTAKGEKPKSKVDEDGKPLTKRGRREERARRQGLNQ